MPYPQTDWKDHVVEHPKTYRQQDNGDGTYTFIDAPGEVIQSGTPMSATNFNHQEDGIGGAAMMADMLFTQVMLLVGHSGLTLEEAYDALNEAKLNKDAKAASAEKADKLTTARTISITGGATADAKSFDGTANVQLNVSELDPAKLKSAVSIGKGGTEASDAAGARKNLDVPSNAEISAAQVLVDAQRSIDIAKQRELEDRLIVAEAQLAALTT